MTSTETLDAPPADLPRKANLSEEEAGSLINSLMRNGSELHQKIKVRRNLFNMKSPPVLMAPLNNVTYQSDLPRRKWVELSNRMCENPLHFNVDAPNDSTPFQTNKEHLAEVLNAGFYIAQERAGYNFQHALADGQIVDCYGIIHWRRAWESYPEMPEAEYLDVLPRGEVLGKNYRRSSTKAEREKGKYKELPDSVEKKTKLNRARAGFPYHIEVIHPDQYYDRSDIKGAIAMAVVVRELDLIEYDTELGEVTFDEKNGIKKKVDMTVDYKIRVYQSDAQPPGALAADYKNRKVTVATLWTRSEWYEMASDSMKANELDSTTNLHAGKGQWTLINHDTHEWNRPPFARADAHRFHTTNPADRWQPALEGVFRLKPDYDFDMALLKGLGERVALPEVYVVRDSNTGMYDVDEDGTIVHLTRDSAKARTLPAGYKLELLKLDLNAAFIEAIMKRREEYYEAAPQTGQAEIGASTQPWTVRLAQEQQAVIPRSLVGNQVYAFQDMARSIVQDMSMMDSEIWVFKRSYEGRENPKEIVGIDPKDIEGLIVSAEINPVSAAERITIEQHGLDLLNNEKVPMTPQWFLEDYMNVPNPNEKIRAHEAWVIAETYKRPLLAQEAVTRWGKRVTQGINGEMIGLGGAVLSAEEVLAINGIRMPKPQPGLVDGSSGGSAGPMMQGGAGAPGATPVSAATPTNDAMMPQTSMAPLQGNQQPAGVLPRPPLGV